MDKIVVLDGYTMNPGDLSWGELNKLGDVIIYERTDPGDVVERLSNCTIALTNKVVINQSHINQLPRLKYIGVMATGYNVVDVTYAKQKGIITTNVSGYSTHSVVQHTFALILELFSNVGNHNQSVTEGKWHTSKDFAYTLSPLRELNEKKIGIIGLGEIGSQVAKVAKAFGMIVQTNYRGEEKKYVKDISYIPMDELFSTSDVISLHCPLTAENEAFVNEELLSKMKRDAIIINTGRGPLINHDDLYKAVNNGIIGGAGLDVYISEPPKDQHPIFTENKIVITPHIAWATKESRDRLLQGVCENISAYQSNKPVNIIN